MVCNSMDILLQMAYIMFKLCESLREAQFSSKFSFQSIPNCNLMLSNHSCKVGAAPGESWQLVCFKCKFKIDHGNFFVPLYIRNASLTCCIAFFDISSENPCQGRFVCKQNVASKFSHGLSSDGLRPEHHRSDRTQQRPKRTSEVFQICSKSCWPPSCGKLFNAQTEAVSLLDSKHGLFSCILISVLNTYWMQALKAPEESHQAVEHREDKEASKDPQSAKAAKEASQRQNEAAVPANDSLDGDKLNGQRQNTVSLGQTSYISARTAEV